jgi:hypothetical protein
MVRAVWICLFFVAVLDADPVTWTVSTPRGPVEITLQQASDERLPYTNKHSVKLSGVVANKTTVDFALAEFKPVIVLKNGSVLKDPLSWDIFERPTELRIVGRVSHFRPSGRLWFVGYRQYHLAT